MISLSGRMLPGLDEFMLRLGHLKVLANVASETGGSRYRVEKTTAELLTAESTVPTEEIPALAEYLHRKRLCVVRDARMKTRDDEGDDNAGVEVRYPDLTVEQAADGKYRLFDAHGPATTATVWWQDRCLADPAIPSKVGAVTVSAKSGSKTGLSHIFDWAEATGLITSTAQPTPEARLVAKLDGKAQGEAWSLNPYRLGADRVLFATALLAADLDIFSRFVVALQQTSWPLKKRQAATLFGQTLSDLVDEADRAPHLTARQKFHLTDQLRELERAARKKEGDLGKASTTWHRAASRLETYVDLGILSKASATQTAYEYTYHATPKLTAFADSVRTESDPEEWIDLRLIEALLGKSTRHEALSTDALFAALKRLLPILSSPTTSYQIAALACGVAAIFAYTEEPISLRCARSSLESLARTHPDIARLARGTAGSAAEYISLDARKI